MKRIKKIRRRNIYILNAVFVASTLLFYEANAGLFIKNFAEKQFTNVFPKGTRVEIGAVKGGILRNLVSEDIKILSKENKPTFTIKRMEINYRLWHSLLSKIPALSDIRGEDKVILFLGGKKEDLLNGFIEMKRVKERIYAKGYISINGDERIFTKGIIEKDGSFKLKLIQGKGTVDITLDKGLDKTLISLKANHIKVHGIDFIGEVNASLASSGEKDINVVFKNLIINYIPFDKELKASLRYNKLKNTLDVIRFVVGTEIRGNGHIELKSPYKTFLKWTINDLDLAEYGTSYEGKTHVSGIMNGEFMLRGPLKKLNFTAHFDAQKGSYADLNFDSAIFNLKGEYPIITLEDSRVIKEGGHIKLDGDINLSKIKDDKAFENFSMEPGENFFVWEGWSVSKEKKDSSVTAEKSVSEELNVSFKASSNDIEKEEEHFLGLEHKVKF